MAKAELKTKENKASVEKFLAGIKDRQQREDSIAIAEMMKKASGDKAKMWGKAIVGFGSTQLKYASGRELDWFKMGFAPRKGNIALYGLNGKDRATLLKKLGKHKTSGGCINIGKLSDVDMKVLKELMK